MCLLDVVLLQLQLGNHDAVEVIERFMSHGVIIALLLLFDCHIHLINCHGLVEVGLVEAAGVALWIKQLCHRG